MLAKRFRKARQKLVDAEHYVWRRQDARKRKQWYHRRGTLTMYVTLFLQLHVAL